MLRFIDETEALSLSEQAEAAISQRLDMSQVLIQAGTKLLNALGRHSTLSCRRILMVQ